MKLRWPLFFLSALLLLMASCQSSKPGNMLEYYYAIPFGDKYSDALTKEQKENLYNSGDWIVKEDSGYANLKANFKDEMYSEEISIRVWNKGNLVAVTTLYDEGSDCPPLSELSLYEYIKGDWMPVEIPPIEVSDYWVDKSKVPDTVINNPSLTEFEPFLDGNSNDIRFEWKHYKCFVGDDEVPDYNELANQRTFNIGADQRDYNQVYLQWNSNFTALEKRFPESIREKELTSNSSFIMEPGTGLLLGSTDGPTTYLVTFSGYEISIKQLNGAILSPQQDDFYIIQPWSTISSTNCAYEQDESSQEEECTSSATKLIISIAKAGLYKQELTRVEDQLENIAQARCGLSEDQFETISYIGRDFIQYTFGGSDSECAPSGPGGGFEKDTIESFSGIKIDMLASGYLNYTDLNMAYDKLFPAEKRSNMSFYLCEPEEMLIGLVHEEGRLKLHVRNNLGRGYQDSREVDVAFSDAPEKFKSATYKPIKDNSIIEGSIDYFPSPDGQYIAVLKKFGDENRLYFYSADDPNALTRITLPGQVAMAEWCDKNYWKKWNKAMDDAIGYVKVQETEEQ